MAKQHPQAPEWIKPDAQLLHTGVPQRMAATFRTIFDILQVQAETIAAMQTVIDDLKKPEVKKDAKDKPTNSKSS